MSIAQTQPGITSVPELKLVEDTLRSVLTKGDGVIRKTCLDLLNSGGKRVRPLLTLNSALCFGPLTKETVYAAAAAELIHMASLVHDDVIDNSATRRGEPSVNSLHGNKSAVLAGDYLFAEAFHILSTQRLLTCMTYLVEAIQDMCDGEVDQAGESYITAIDQDKYFGRIAKKTAILLSACCKCGGATAGASEEDVAALGRYGMYLGYAFQIVDDILDFTGSPEKLGKPVGSDLTSGTVTLPVIFLMENPIYAGWIKEVLQRRNVTACGIDNIKEALLRAGSIDSSYSSAKDCIVKAKASLDHVPYSRYKELLLNLADKVLKRQA